MVVYLRICENRSKLIRIRSKRIIGPGQTQRLWTNRLVLLVATVHNKLGACLANGAFCHDRFAKVRDRLTKRIDPIFRSLPIVGMRKSDSVGRWMSPCAAKLSIFPPRQYASAL